MDLFGSEDGYLLFSDKDTFQLSPQTSLASGWNSHFITEFAFSLSTNIGVSSIVTPIILIIPFPIYLFKLCRYQPLCFQENLLTQKDFWMNHTILRNHSRKNSSRRQQKNSEYKKMEDQRPNTSTLLETFCCWIINCLDNDTAAT